VDDWSETGCSCCCWCPLASFVAWKLGYHLSEVKGMMMESKLDPASSLFMSSRTHVAVPACGCQLLLYLEAHSEKHVLGPILAKESFIVVTVQALCLVHAD